MRAQGWQQPRRGEMGAVGFGQDDIARIFVVELVDFEPAVENRDLPFEEIDEYGFAGREHGAQHSVRHRPERFFHNMQHGQAPLVVNDQGSGRRLSRRYSQKWGWQQPPMSLNVRVSSPRDPPTTNIRILPWYRPTAHLIKP